MPMGSMSTGVFCSPGPCHYQTSATKRCRISWKARRQPWTRLGRLPKAGGLRMTDDASSVRSTPARAGTVSAAFAHLLEKYGASPRLLRRVREVVADDRDTSVATSPKADTVDSLRGPQMESPHAA